MFGVLLLIPLVARTIMFHSLMILVNLLEFICFTINLKYSNISRNFSVLVERMFDRKSF
jgi:hypothetical protein